MNSIKAEAHWLSYIILHKYICVEEGHHHPQFFKGLEEQSIRCTA